MRPPSSNAFRAAPLADRLLNDAFLYVRYLAAQGGDFEPFLPALQVFKSHFAEWTENLHLGDIYASIPLLGTPPKDPRVYMVKEKHDPIWRTKSGDELDVQVLDLPPVIAQVVMLATQYKILKGGEQIWLSVDVETINMEKDKLVSYGF